MVLKHPLGKFLRDNYNKRAIMALNYSPEYHDTKHQNLESGSVGKKRDFHAFPVFIKVYVKQVTPRTSFI